MENTTELSDWYNTPLTMEDMLAGGLLLLFGCTFAPLCIIVSYVMYKNDKDIIGFRFLFSASLADILLLLNYSIWPGFTILIKNEVIPLEARHWLQMYLDWAWFSMCYHYMVIAWSRFAAIRFPNTFRIQSRQWSYSVCAGCYVVALLQVLLTHFQPWYVTFYYEPSHYGMLSEDFHKYLTEGQSIFFFTFHLLMMIIPIGFYSCAIVLLFKHRHGAILQSHKPHSIAHSNVEARLIIPCIFNSVVFIIGQVVITIGTGEGKWATWMVMLLFSCNSAVNPVLLILFSAIIRNKILQMFKLAPTRETKYMVVPNGQTSCSPSPPLKTSGERLSNSRSIPIIAGKISLISKDNFSCAV